MKKNYSAPFAEIIVVSTEDIMILSLNESGEGDSYNWEDRPEGLSL